jgi:hypothetical protein
LTVERLAGTAIIERRLTGRVETGLFQHLVDVGSRAPSNTGVAIGTPVAKLLGELDDAGRRQAWRSARSAIAIDRSMRSSQRLDVALLACRHRQHSPILRPSPRQAQPIWVSRI